MTSRKTPRRRRRPEDARREILAVAARHLAATGPAAIRLQAIAREMGVTHQAILRHFRTRDALLVALLRHAGRELRDGLSAAVRGSVGAPLDAGAFFTALDRMYRRRGYARLSAWLFLGGYQPRGAGMFRDSAERLHRARKDAPRIEDTIFALLLLNLAAWSDALVGPAFRRAFDLPADAATARRFRAWVVQLVDARLR
jgi:AcrR family transcriptional regulator